MSVHLAGILGLVVIFVLGTLRPINLGVLALAMTFVVGSFAARETPAEMYRGFPVDLFVLLTGVTYLFAVAERNGTLARIVDGSVRLARGRRRLIPWVVFAVAAAPAMAGRHRIGGRGAARAHLDAARGTVCDRPPAHRPDGGPRRRRGKLLAAQRARRHRAAGRDQPRRAALRLGLCSPATSSTTSCSARSSSRSSAGVERHALEAAPLATAAVGSEPNRQARPRRDRGSNTPARCWPWSRSRSSRWGSASASASSRSPPAHCSNWPFRARRAGAERQVAWPVVLLVCGIVTYVARAAAVRHGRRGRPRHSRPRDDRSSWRCCCARLAR